MADELHEPTPDMGSGTPKTSHFRTELPADMQVQKRAMEWDGWELRLQK